MVFAAATGALKPILAQQRVNVSAGRFGLLSTATGIGAVATALALPRLRRVFSPDVLAHAGSVLLAVSLVALGRVTTLVPFVAVLVVAGVAQLCVFSTTFVTAQAVLPNWVRGRGLAIAMLVVQGVTVLASLGCGALMSRRGASFTLTVAGIGMLITTIALLPVRLNGRAEVDLSPALAAAWPHPHTALAVDGGRSPVLVTINYMVQPERTSEYLVGMNTLRLQRRRNGAMSWGLFEVADTPNAYIETFLLSTWDEHEREQHRRTAADARIHATVREFLVVGSTPQANHCCRR